MTLSSGYSSPASSQSIQYPSQLLCRHLCLDAGGAVVTGGTPVAGAVGGAVIVCVKALVGLVGSVVVSSQQPQNRPGDEQLVDVSVGVDVEVRVRGEVVSGMVVVVAAVVVDDDPESVGSSLQPQNRPGVEHVVVVLVVVLPVVVVLVVVFSVVEVVVVVDVVSSSRVVVIPLVVVVSSRQPHQPGVLHVCVRVRVEVDVELVEVVVPSVPLLSYIFQLPQSRHSGVSLHTGTSS